MQLFFSYAREDVRYVKRVYRQFCDYCDCWIDEEGLQGGSNLKETIKSEIEAAGALLLFWSKSANKSQWVQKETDLFLSLEDSFRSQRTIIPIILDATPLPQNFSKLRFIDSTGRAFSKRMYREVSSALRNNPLLIGK